MTSRRSGFTLISVLVAMVLISIGVMALARTQFMVIKITREENQRNQSLQLASAYMEEVRSRNAWNLVTEAAAVIDSTGAVNANGKFTRELIVVDEGAQLMRVTVRVTARNTKPLDLRTLIFRVSQ